MALTHRSIATIDSPEFINLQPLDINPLMSACEIKVFYLGESRNKTFISNKLFIFLNAVDNFELPAIKILFVLFLTADEV